MPQSPGDGNVQVMNAVEERCGREEGNIAMVPGGWRNINAAQTSEIGGRDPKKHTVFLYVVLAKGVGVSQTTARKDSLGVRTASAGSSVLSYCPHAADAAAEQKK